MLFNLQGVYGTTVDLAVQNASTKGAVGGAGLTGKNYLLNFAQVILMRASPPYRINQYSTHPVCRVISLAKYSTPILITLHQIPSKQFLFTGKESLICQASIPITGKRALS